MSLLTIFTFLGRLHPLVVHLPIGFLLLAVLFDGVSYIKGYDHLKPAVSFTLLAGFAAAVVACIFGYLLSLTGDYDPTILSHHMISGITLAVLSGLLFFTTTPKFKTFYQLPSAFFSCLLAGLVILIGYSGHQGGNLTHGSDYLNLKILAEGQRNHPTRVEDALIFEDVVHPILESKCGKCHEGGKLKGKLSIADLKSLLKGGKTGPAVVPGRLGESELYRRITLPPDQEKFMPSDGKPPLTATEVTIIRWWIEKANAAEGKKMSELKDKDVITPQVAYVLGLGGAAAPGDVAGRISGAAGTQGASRAGASNTGTSGSTGSQSSGIAGSDNAQSSGIADTSFPAQQINPDIPPVMDKSLVDNLRKKGLMVRVLLQSPLMLDVVLPAGSGIKIAGIKDDLVRAGKNIIWLNLSDNGFTENDLGFLKQLPNIEKLRLEKNPISDGISDEVVNLKHLEAINLNETKVSGTCLAQLGKNPALKRIYTWKTAVKQN